MDCAIRYSVISAVQLEQQIYRSVATTACALFLAAGIAAADNSVVLKDQTGTAQTSRPVTISRVFKQGEIAQFPRPALSGIALSQWQANVMNRWPDGSVKHALITFRQSIPANGTVTVLFQNDPNPCHLGNQDACDAAAPTQSQIRGFNGGAWGAQITTTENSATFSVSAQTMIGNGAWRFWVKGPLMNQIIVEDRSAARAYDFGYKDKSLAVLSAAFGMADTAIQVEDGSDIAALPMPTVVSVQGEQMQICSVTGNKLNVCPGGRGFNGTKPINGAPWYGLVQALSIPQGTWKAATTNIYKSLHPIFVLTQYAGWPGVKEEFILDNDWMDREQDQIYSVTLYSGASKSIAYAKTSFTMPANSRWRKVFWDGRAPGNINVDFNFPYMVATKAIANYDTSLAVPPASVQSEVAAFTATDRCDLGGFGQWTGRFEATGGRPDLGFTTRWNTRWLYTQDPNLYQVMIGNADCGPQIPVHFRESDATRWYDAGHTVSAMGLPISLVGRPGWCDRAPNCSQIVPDGIWPMGQTSGGTFVDPKTGSPGWGPDVAHHADFAYIPYLVTGDWFYWEELQFWANWCIFNNDGTDRPGSGYIRRSASELRGQAWGFRTLTNAAFISPDRIAAANFLTSIDANIAIWEGQLNITNGRFYDPGASSNWYYGRNSIGRGLNNPLYFLNDVWLPTDATVVDPAKSCGGHAEWQMHLMDAAWGRASELGFTEVDTLRKTALKRVLHELLDPSYDPYLSAEYQTGTTVAQPGCALTTPFFTNWGAVKAAYLPTIISGEMSNWNRHLHDGEFGYVNIMRAAASFLSSDLSDGGLTSTAAWTWVAAHAEDVATLSDNPKWAFNPAGLPLASTPTGPITSANRCDLNGDGLVNAADAQIATAQVVGSSACTNGDVNKDGACSVIDVQIVVNAAASGSCAVQ